MFRYDGRLYYPLSFRSHYSLTGKLHDCRLSAIPETDETCSIHDATKVLDETPCGEKVVLKRM
jgi:hypothetical protein